MKATSVLRRQSVFANLTGISLFLILVNNARHRSVQNLAKVKIIKYKQALFDRFNKIMLFAFF